MPVYSLPRQVKTNQRIYFDISSDGTVLLSGNHDGDLSLYNITSDGGMFESRNVAIHGDTVNGVAIHPIWNLLATTSGQRRFGDEAVGDYSLRIWRL